MRGRKWGKITEMGTAPSAHFITELSVMSPEFSQDNKLNGFRKKFQYLRDIANIF